MSWPNPPPPPPPPPALVRSRRNALHPIRLQMIPRLPMLLFLVLLLLVMVVVWAVVLCGQQSSLCRCFLRYAYALRINRNIHCRHVHLFCIYGTSGTGSALSLAAVQQARTSRPGRAAESSRVAVSRRITGNSRWNLVQWWCSDTFI